VWDSFFGAISLPLILGNTAADLLPISAKQERQLPTVVAGICVGKTQGRKKSSSSSESLCFNGPSYFIDLQSICFQYAWGRA
jgi:hypothetical protein